MKIKVTEATYEEAMREAVKEYRNPPNSSLLLRTLVRLYSIPELRSVGFTYTKEGMERLRRKEPCLILMNHSSFIDLEIASRILYPKPFHIVCTSDGFVGKEGDASSAGYALCAGDLQEFGSDVSGGKLQL